MAIYHRTGFVQAFNNLATSKNSLSTNYLNYCNMVLTPICHMEMRILTNWTIYSDASDINQLGNIKSDAEEYFI